MGLGAESVHWPAGSSVLLTTAVGLTTGISAKHTRNTVISLVKYTFLPFKYGLNDLALWLLTVQSSQRTNACLNLIKLIPETFMITWIHPQQNPKFRRIMRRKKKKITKHQARSTVSLDCDLCEQCTQEHTRDLQSDMLDKHWQRYLLVVKGKKSSNKPWIPQTKVMVSPTF